MLLSPSTLSTIVAILSAQGVVATHDQVQASLAALTGEEPSPELALQPGEFFLTINEEDGNDTYHSVDSLKKYLQNQAEGVSNYFGCNNPRSIDDFITVYVCRRQLSIDSDVETVTKITIE